MIIKSSNGLELFIMEEYIQISKLNDFIFCPRSMYLHSIYESFNEKVYHETPQVIGKIKHATIDEKRYSTRKDILQGSEVYSQKYNLVGKIDIYDKKKGELVERKTKIQKIYDGYKYQLYAQYFCLKEEGYDVKKIFLHSLNDNKRYEIELPDELETKKFEFLISNILNFDILKNNNLKQNPNKCEKCIYRHLCV
ncbi:MAG: type V CRISPR-associated protein Cas4 [Patescibacteria group bacterium]